MTQIRSFLLVLALAIGLLAAPGSAWAADRIELKDGRVFEGTIVREVEGYIWIKAKMGGLERELMFKPDEIKTIERTADSKATSEPVSTTPKPESGSKARSASGAPRAAIITLGEGGDKDMVGIFMTADSLERALPMLEQDNIEVVVFLINSGGGAGPEIKKISDVIENKYKPRFRVVAWIESAISAAAMVAHTMEEIYFMPTANYGACTGYRGALHAVDGRELEQYLFLMEQISDRGRHNRAIMRSMQIMDPLSCTIDERGDVHWYPNTDGEHVVNPSGRVLTLTAQDAVEFKFAKGIAANHNELARLMGYQEIEWVGRAVPGVAYPVSKAEEHMRTFRGRTFDDQSRMQEFMVQFNSAMEMAASRPPDERGPFLGRAQDALNRIESMLRNNPNVAIFVIGAPLEQVREWIEQQRERIRQLRRR
jgi:hypothetical protein